MRALTLTQPWTGLVAANVKQVENRDRRVINPRYIGQPFAIHASREVDESVYQKIDTDRAERRRTGVLWDPIDVVAWYSLSRITSAIIAVATVAELFDVAGRGTETIDLMFQRRVPWMDAGPRELQLRFVFGPFVYVLRDIRALTEPVSCPGHQWFWELSPELEAQVLSRLPGAA